jgi:hypothetical protein
VSAILFYLAGNPPCGLTRQCIEKNDLEEGSNVTLLDTSELAGLLVSASASWWLLFIVRQLITLTMAKATQAFLVDYLALRSRWIVWMLGPFVTLFMVQSKGWPLQLFFWGVYDFAFLYGSAPWAQHWLHWQDAIWMCNARNPSGNITNDDLYFRALVLAVLVSLVTAMKRFWVGLYLGKQTFGE